MGQYHVLVNLDKREYVNPSGLGSSIKLWEIMANHPSAACALVPLLACSNGRGGGDLNTDYNWNVGGSHLENGETGEMSNIPSDKAVIKLNDEPDKEKGVIGRWAGDRVAFVGDYAVCDDLQWSRNGKTAADIYGLCATEEQWDRYKLYEHGIKKDDLFTDITPLVQPMIEQAMGGEFIVPRFMQDLVLVEETGYRDWKPTNRDFRDTLIGDLSHIVTQLKEDRPLLNTGFIDNALDRAREVLNIEEETNGTTV